MKRPLAVMMNRTIRTVPGETTLADAAKLMRDVRVGALMVEEKKQLVGIISETDLVRRGLAEDSDPHKVKVLAIMSAPIISVEVDRPASDASDIMSDKGIRHLGVTESGKIIGVISVRDLLRYYKNWGAF